jgi:hypothetical protein
VRRLGWEHNQFPSTLVFFPKSGYTNTLPSSTAVELGCRRAKGLLSPALSSRGGEGDTAEAFDKSLNSMAVLPSSPSQRFFWVVLNR